MAKPSIVLTIVLSNGDYFVAHHHTEAEAEHQLSATVALLGDQVDVECSIIEQY